MQLKVVRWPAIDATLVLMRSVEVKTFRMRLVWISGGGAMVDSTGKDSAVMACLSS